jgi:hypothetical protein
LGSPKLSAATEYSRPSAAAQYFHEAAIPTAALFRDLPDGQFKLIGLNGH